MFVLLMSRHALHTLSPTLRIVCISFDTEHRLEARERNCRVVKSCYTESKQRSFRKKFFQGISSGVTMTTYSGTAYPMAEQGSSSSDLPFPAWQREHKAALLELDPKKLLERVHAAEDAIFNRLQELSHSDNPDHKAERQAIEDAIASLRVLKTEKLNYPDWKST